MKKFSQPEVRRITEIHTFDQFLAQEQSLKDCTLQGLDLTDRDINWEEWTIDNTTFLGCKLSPQDEEALRLQGAYIYQAPDYLPYAPFRKKLYDWKELMEGFAKEEDNSLDYKIYQYFSRHRFNPNVNEALWQRIHDHAIDDALRDLLKFDEEGMTQLRCVGIMGGHRTPRHDSFYLKTAQTAKLLAENDYYIVSGGGPGIMEAANLGAYFAGRADGDLLGAINLLQKAPSYEDEGYQEQARAVLEKYPEGTESLAIPTWFYGHEPSNLFSTHIAKYFSNSIREDTLLSICLHGIVFAPGSAGTMQEIFMDATQNHYGTFQYYSPMVFLGQHRYEIETLIFPLLRQLAWGQRYYEFLHISDEPEDILRFLEEHPPIPVE